MSGQKYSAGAAGSSLPTSSRRRGRLQPPWLLMANPCCFCQNRGSQWPAPKNQAPACGECARPSRPRSSARRAGTASRATQRWRHCLARGWRGRYPPHRPGCRVVRCHWPATARAVSPRCRSPWTGNQSTHRPCPERRHHCCPNCGHWAEKSRPAAAHPKQHSRKTGRWSGQAAQR